jgi:hypothetical protein
MVAGNTAGQAGLSQAGIGDGLMLNSNHPHTQKHNRSPISVRIRKFILCLANGSVVTPEDMPKVLGRLARSALARARPNEEVVAGEVKDLVSDLFYELWNKGLARGGLSALAAEWAQWPDARLVGTLREMLFHLAVETSPNWKTVRNVRQAVKEALARGIPPAPAALPTSLFTSGRLNIATVGAACAFALARTGAELKSRGGESVPKVAEWLLTQYRMVDVACEPLDEAVEGSVPASAPHLSEAVSTARAVARDFARRAGSEGVQLLKLRRRGFKELASALGIAIGTAHLRFGCAVQLFRDVADSHEATAGEQFLALQFLEVS